MDGALGPLRVLEALAQLGSWLILVSSDFKRRPVLATIGRIVVHGEARPGDRIRLETRVQDLSIESAVLSGCARVDDRLVLEVEDLLCAMVDATLLDPVESTRRTWAWLSRQNFPSGRFSV